MARSYRNLPENHEQFIRIRAAMPKAISAYDPVFG